MGVSCAVVATDHRGQFVQFAVPPAIRVVGTIADGPALKTGDVILAVDNHPITTRAGALRMFFPASGQVRVLIRRGGRDVELRGIVSPTCTSAPTVFVTATDKQSPKPLSFVGGDSSPASASPQPKPQPRVSAQPAPAVTLGMDLACDDCGWDPPLPGNRRWRWHSANFPLVQRVAPGGPADVAGVKVGDILLSLDGVSLTSPEVADAYRKTLSGRAVRIKVRRGIQTLDLQIIPGKGSAL